jgi:hypothetical protein
MLEERPFSSYKVLRRHFRIGTTACLLLLHDNLGLQKSHFRWVPHGLSIIDRSERVSYSKLHLAAPTRQKASGFQQITTGDELWFFFSYLRGSV